MGRTRSDSIGGTWKYLKRYVDAFGTCKFRMWKSEFTQRQIYLKTGLFGCESGSVQAESRHSSDMAHRISNSHAYWTSGNQLALDQLTGTLHHPDFSLSYPRLPVITMNYHENHFFTEPHLVNHTYESRKCDLELQGYPSWEAPRAWNSSTLGTLKFKFGSQRAITRTRRKLISEREVRDSTHDSNYWSCKIIPPNEIILSLNT